MPRTSEERALRQAKRRPFAYAACGGTGSPFGSILLIAAGVLLFLSSIGILPIRDIWSYWPVFILVVGISRLISGCDARGRVLAVLMIFFGTVFLGDKLGWYSVHAHDGSWVVGIVLLAIGVASLLKPASPAPVAPPPFTVAGDNFAASGLPQGGDAAGYPLNESVFFGSIERRIESQACSNGAIQAIFGSVELDLRLARMATDTLVLQINATFASIEIRIPSDWLVSTQLVGSVGSVEDHTLPSVRPDALRPRLLLTGHYVCSSIEIQS